MEEFIVNFLGLTRKAYVLAIVVVALIGILCGTMYVFSNEEAASPTSSQGARGGVVVVTGANSGIGFETARLLAIRNQFSTIILACRNQKRGVEAARKIQSETKSLSVNVVALQMDLASVRSIESFVGELENRNLASRVTTLINNGGVNTFGKSLKTKDNLEYTFGINYFGHFVLTTALLSKRKENEVEGKLRVVNLSSVMHWTGKTDFDVLSTTYRRDSYSSSKLAMNLFALELEKRFPRRCVAFAVNPGAVQSNIYRDMHSFVGHFFIRMLWLHTETGALASVRAATMRDADVDRIFGTSSTKGGRRRGAKYLTPYYVPEAAPEWARRLLDIGGPFFAGVRSTRPSESSGDIAASADLWETSQRILGGIIAKRDEAGR